MDVTILYLAHGQMGMGSIVQHLAQHLLAIQLCFVWINHTYCFVNDGTAVTKELKLPFIRTF
jgi:hypothetical protein